MSKLLSGNHYTDAGRLGRVWHWWTGELKDMLPASVRRSLLTGQTLLLTVEKRQLVLYRETASGVEEVERIPMPETPAGHDSQHAADSGRDGILCLTDEHVFSRSLVLPMAAEENLREVLSFEMDRHTPFSADQVYYDYLVEERSKEKGTLNVKVFVVLKEKLDRLIGEVEQQGVYVTQVTSYRGDLGDRVQVNLLPKREGAVKRGGINRLNLLLLASAVLLVVGAAGLPIYYKHQAVKQLEPRLAEVTSEAKRAVAVKDELDRKITESKFLFEKKQLSVFLLEVIRELTVLLPDDTWLMHMEVENGEVHIRGESPAAATLIPIIESSQLFHNARFRSPVTQNRRTNAERFHLSAQIGNKGELL